MKKASLYVPTKSFNDATSYYIGVIRSALESMDIETTISYSLDDVREADIVVTIERLSFLKAKIKNHKAKTIYWSQGTSPEEAIMESRTLKNYYRYCCRYILDRFAVNTADLLLFVSNGMLKHYRSFYQYKKQNYLIMPCFNMPLSEHFIEERYTQPSFVYAGGASAWQCVNEILDVYQKIEWHMPEASLTILTGSQEVFVHKIAERAIKHYDIKYVKLEEMNEELSKYKYGFLLRENNVVNYVATPTKMNSYLSNYLIPIYSDAVEAFQSNITLGRYTLMEKCPLDVDGIVTHILDFENKVKDFSDYRNIVKNIFKTYYNRDVYVANIVDKLKEMIS